MKKLLNNKIVRLIILSIITFIVGILKFNLTKGIILVIIVDILYFFIIYMSKHKKPNYNNKKINKKGKSKLFKTLLLIFFITCIIGTIFVGLYLYSIVKNAPDFDPDELYSEESTIVYGSDGSVIAELGTELREIVAYKDLPEVLINAIVATEDSNFFIHNGVDLSRFFVATLKQATTSSGGGASTLTMQLSKLTYTSSVTSIKRKLTDMYVAMFNIEQEYTKEEILEFYVNNPYLGSGAWGVEQACQTYFNKSVSEINLSESALIAGLFQAPHGYDPRLYPDAAEARRKTVLYLMKRHGYITEEEYNIAIKLTVDKIVVTNISTVETNNYQAFIDTVVEEVYADTGLDPYSVSMAIYSTMDPNKQTTIDKIMSGETFTWENDYVDAGVSVIDVKTGEIAAIGAGRNRVGERQYNTATMISKQIGSTSKPIYDYIPGIEFLNWSTYKPFIDEVYSYSDGTNINNWDRKYNGFLTLRTALAESRNVPALKAFKENDNSTIKEVALSFGLSPEIDSNGNIHEAHAIGGYTGESPLTMSAAYAVFANGGYYITPHSYTSILVKEKNTTIKKTIEKNQVISEDSAYLMTSLLQSSGKYGLGSLYNINGAIYGAKSGTSNYSQETINTWGFPNNSVNDLWIDAISPDYAISIWYGYKKTTAGYTNTTNTLAHKRLFNLLAKSVFNSSSNWTKPDGVVEVTVENETYPAALPSEYTPDSMKVTELFKVGTEPTEISTRYSKLENVTNLTGNIEDDKLILNWDKIETPDPLNETLINTYLDSLYVNSATKTAAKAARLAYNSSFFGTVIYKIYSKDSNGDLALVDTTSSNTLSIAITSSSPDTYIVKTSYTKFTSNISTGKSITIDIEEADSKLTAELNGSATIEAIIGSTLSTSTYDKTSIKTLLDAVATTSSDISIKVTYKNSSGANVSTINTTTANTYTITYTITYKTQTVKLTRTIVVS